MLHGLEAEEKIIAILFARFKYVVTFVYGNKWTVFAQ
jgi:hypothetical protein